MTFPSSFSKRISDKDYTYSWCENFIYCHSVLFFSFSSAERLPSNLQITGYKQWSTHTQCRPTTLGIYVWLQIMFCKCVKQTKLFSFFSFFFRIQFLFLVTNDVIMTSLLLVKIIKLANVLIFSETLLFTRDDVVGQHLKFGSAFLSSSWESKIALFF